MTERFPLAPAVTEENRGVDPDVLRDIGYELPFDHIPDAAVNTEAADSTAQSDNVIGIENVPETPGERKRAENSNTHPTRRHLREMPRQGANNEPPAEFNPDDEHRDAAVIGIAAVRTALSQRRRN